MHFEKIFSIYRCIWLENIINCFVVKIEGEVKGFFKKAKINTTWVESPPSFLKRFPPPEYG